MVLPLINPNFQVDFGLYVLTDHFNEFWMIKSFSTPFVSENNIVHFDV